MSDSLEPLDPAWVAEQLSKSPFVTIPGVTNVRCLGLPPMASGNTGLSKIFRSADVSGVTEEGKLQMKKLGITTVYDLRSDTEMKKYKTPIPTIEGVDVQHIPVFKIEDYSPEVMARRFQLYASAKIESFMELYSQILEAGGPAFSIVLKHVRDHPDDGLLFHCTAGKDRTGILAAILLLLAGVEDDAIAKDYELTRIGREPMRDVIMQRLSLEPIFANDKEAAWNMLSSRHETMIAFLKLLRGKYGGVEKYLGDYVGLTDEDIRTIRRNLVRPVVPTVVPTNTLANL